MAGKIIGRHTAPCASCDFEGVHVKQNDGKLPYMHCPECGLMTPAKNGQQAQGLLRHTRAQKIDQAATPAPASAIPQPPVAAQPIVVPQDPAPAARAPADPPAPAAPAKRAGLWDSLMNKA